MLCQLWKGYLIVMLDDCLHKQSLDSVSPLLFRPIAFLDITVIVKMLGLVNCKAVGRKEALPSAKLAAELKPSSFLLPRQCPRLCKEAKGKM